MLPFASAMQQCFCLFLQYTLNIFDSRDRQFFATFFSGDVLEQIQGCRIYWFLRKCGRWDGWVGSLWPCPSGFSRSFEEAPRSEDGDSPEFVSKFRCDDGRWSAVLSMLSRYWGQASGRAWWGSKHWTTWPLVTIFHIAFSIVRLRMFDFSWPSVWGCDKYNLHQLAISEYIQSTWTV